MQRVRRLKKRITDRLIHGLTIRLPKPLAERVPLLIVLGLIGLGIGGWIFRSVIRSDKQEIYKYKHPSAIESANFLRSTAVMGFPMVGGNAVQILNNGDAIFSAMLKDIQGARHTVHLESFIFRSDPAGEPFIEALSEAAKRGVEVRLLIDAIGSKLARKDRQRMEDAGVKVRTYRPLFTFRLHKVSQRTHRKILVVDGRIAYTGGTGIGKEWLGNAGDPEEWRDTHVRVEGPVAAQMQAVFSENWVYTTGEILMGDNYYPAIQPAGQIMAQAMRTSRGDASSIAKMIYFVALESAKKRIYITNPYFLPDKQMRKALIAASKRGVDIQILLPGKHTDAKFIRAASRFHYRAMLEAGIRVFEYKPTMMHAKNFVADGVYSTIGSINFDVRSMSVNAENSLAFYDPGFGAQMEAMFEKDKASAEEIKADRWKKRGPFVRAGEFIARTWEPYY